VFTISSAPQRADRDHHGRRCEYDYDECHHDEYRHGRADPNTDRDDPGPGLDDHRDDNAVTNPDTDSNADANSHTNRDINANGHTDSNADANGHTDSNADANGHSNTHTDGHGDAFADTEICRHHRRRTG
jgi:hypothetical protein